MLLTLMVNGNMEGVVLVCVMWCGMARTPGMWGTMLGMVGWVRVVMWWSAEGGCASLPQTLKIHVVNLFRTSEVRNGGGVDLIGTVWK